MQPVVALEEGTVAGRRPAGESSDPRTCREALWARVASGPVLVGRHDQAGLEQHLKAVADAEDQLLLIAEPPQGVAEEVGELVGEDLAGRHVVAVGEAAGDDEDLVALQRGRAARAGG